jgi:hypothetical protein
MELYVVYFNPRRLPTKHEVAAQIRNLVDRVKSKHGEIPVIVGTAEFLVSACLIEAEVPFRYFPYGLDYELNMKLQTDAQEFAQEVVQKVGGENKLLFRGVNLLNVFLYEIAMQFRTILRIKQSLESEARKREVVILVTTISQFSTEWTDTELPIQETIQVGNQSRMAHIVRIVRTRRILDPDLWRTVLRRHFKFEGQSATIQMPFMSVKEGVKSVLFVVTDTGSMYTVEPFVSVLKELSKQSDLAPIIAVDNTFTQRYFRESNFDSTRYSPVEPSEARSHWAISESLFKGKVKQLMSTYRNEAIKSLMLTAFLQNYLAWQRLAQVYSRIVWLHQLFETIRPDAAVVLPTHAYLGNIAGTIARNNGVPTLSWIGNWPIGERPDPELRLYLTCNNVTDFVTCYSEKFKETLVTGIDPNKLMATGNPKFDLVSSRNLEDDRRFVSSRFGIPQGEFIFLVSTSLVAPDTNTWVRALVRQLKKLQPGTFRLIIKPHPDENPSEYARILEEEHMSTATITDKKCPLYRLLGACDILFTSVSVTGSEAVLFNKPIICINLSDTDYAVRYDKEGVAVLVEREQDILPTIDSVLHDKSRERELDMARKRFQQDYAFGLDGRSSERFVNAIRQVLRRDPS